MNTIGLKVLSNLEGVSMENEDIRLLSNLEGVSMENEDIRLLQQAELDLSVEIPSPPPVLFQGDKTMISKGDFSVVVGAAKSRKTFCVSAMVT